MGGLHERRKADPGRPVMCEATADSRGAGWYCCRDNSYNSRHRSACWVCDKKRHEERPVPRKPDGETGGDDRAGDTKCGRRRNPRTRKATGIHHAR
jgi:hypothetical protein